jgi:DNA-binding MarR family transcriptional regulator
LSSEKWEGDLCITPDAKVPSALRHIRRFPSHFYEPILPRRPLHGVGGRIDLSPRYQLLCPWPEKSLAFTTAIERVADLIGRARSVFAGHFEVTAAGWRLLQLVEQSGSKATLTRMARRLNVTRPSASETASRLSAAGYLSIGRSSVDRRVRRLTITEAGVECLSELDAGLQALLLEMTNDVPAASLEEAARILDRMAKRLRACETVFRRQP